MPLPNNFKLKFNLDTLVSPIESTLFHSKASPLIWFLLSVFVFIPLAPVFALMGCFGMAASIFALRKYKETNKSNYMKNWWDEVVIITGGAHGLGKGLAQTLIKNFRPKKVIVLDINEPDFKDERLVYFNCDISQPEKVKEIVQKIESQIGLPTILVNAAGIVSGKPLLELEPEDMKRTIDVNLLGLMYMTKYVIASMKQNKKKGHIVNVASVLGIAGASNVSDYCASKFGVIGFNDSLRQELKGSDIKTSVICPALISTGMFNGVKYKFPFVTPELETEQVVDAIVKVLQKDENADVRLPFMVKITGFISHVFPLQISDLARHLLGVNSAMLGYIKSHEKKND